MDKTNPVFTNKNFVSRKFEIASLYEIPTFHFITTGMDDRIKSSNSNWSINKEKKNETYRCSVNYQIFRI